VNYRLLANTISHQWVGRIRPAPLRAMTGGSTMAFARYSEARYVEQAAGQAGLEETVKDMSVGALSLRHRAAFQFRKA